MRETLALGILVVVASACGEPTLDCEAQCNVDKCVFAATSCQSADACKCSDSITNEDVKSAYNDCGTKSTCSEVKACWDDAVTRGLMLRPIDREVADACGSYAVRCQLDSSSLCALWSVNLQVLYSADYLSRVVHCYETVQGCSATATDTCLDYAEPTSCAGQ